LPGQGFHGSQSDVHSRTQRETQIEGKINQNLKAGFGWKSSDGEMVSGGAVKERKVWRSSKIKGERHWGQGGDGGGGGAGGGRLLPLLRVQE
jgi:hypothetical protein